MPMPRRVKFRLLWSPAKKALASIIHLKDMYNAFETALVRAADQASIVADGEPVPATAGRDSTDPYVALRPFPCVPVC